MKKLWTFLNCPLVVALTVVALTVSAIRYGFSNAVDSLAESTKVNRNLEALGRLELLSLVEAQGDSSKFVGELKNHSGYPIGSIHGTLCFWDSEGKLVNAYTQGLEGIGDLPAGDSRHFSVERKSSYGGDMSDSEIVEPTQDFARVTLAFIEVETLPTE
jgi:hypothetical protein